MVRLSPILLKRAIRKEYWYRTKWKNHSKRPLTEPAPEYYAKQGFTVHNVADEMRAEEAIPYGHFEYSSSHPKFAKPIAPGPQHPRWQGGSMAFACNENTRLLEGCRQAQLLTNTAVYLHAPAQFDQLFEAAERLIERKGEALQQTLKELIMQSVRWDPANEDLPRRYWHTDRRYSNYRGITYERSAAHIISGMVRSCEALLCENDMGDVIRRRWLERTDIRLSLDYPLRIPPDPGIREGQQVRNIINAPEHVRLQFEPVLDMMLTSPTPLTPFSTSDEVAATANVQHPLIYPVKETIDLDAKTCYVWDNLYLFKNIDSLPSSTTDELHPHTIFQIHNYKLDPWVSDWTFSQRHAKALTTCFAVCGAQARRLYGAHTAGRLPKPVCVQLVFTNRGYDYAFYAFQLNTLDLHDAVKNQCWIDTRWVMPFIDELAEERSVKPEEFYYQLFALTRGSGGMLGYPEYREFHSRPRMPFQKLVTFNRSVFSKICALNLNGLLSLPILKTMKQAEETATAAV